MHTQHPLTPTNRTTPVLTGVFFIIATAAAITGLALYAPLLNDADYLVRGAASSNQIITGAILELLVTATVAGTGIALYPYLRRYNESLALGYVCFRLLEAVCIAIGIISVLGLLTLSKAYAGTPHPDTADFTTTGTVLKGLHDWSFIMGPNFMLGINTFLYSYVFYRSGLVPRKLALLGITGAVLIFAAALLELFGVVGLMSPGAMVLGLPVFAYELILAFWLIFKGFDLRGKRVPQKH
jgi:hypothetical protein